MRRDRPPRATRARPHENRAPLNRGAADPGQGRRFFDHGIGPDEVGIAGIEAATFEQMLHPRGNPLEHDADFVIRRGWERPEIERVPFVGSVEDAIEEQRVEKSSRPSSPKARSSSPGPWASSRATSGRA
jgi:hypothetical protein